MRALLPLWSTWDWNPNLVKATLIVITGKWYVWLSLMQDMLIYVNLHCTCVTAAGAGWSVSGCWSSPCAPARQPDVIASYLCPGGPSWPDQRTFWPHHVLQGEITLDITCFWPLIAWPQIHSTFHIVFSVIDSLLPFSLEDSTLTLSLSV